MEVALETQDFSFVLFLDFFMLWFWTYTEEKWEERAGVASKLWDRTKFLRIRKDTLGEGRTGRGIQGGKLEHQMLSPGGEGVGEPAAGQLEHSVGHGKKPTFPLPTSLKWCLAQHCSCLNRSFLWEVWRRSWRPTKQGFQTHMLFANRNFMSFILTNKSWTWENSGLKEQQCLTCSRYSLILRLPWWPPFCPSPWPQDTCMQATGCNIKIGIEGVE